MEDTITKEEIIALMRDRGMIIERVIDAVIDANAIIGVGLITLAQTLYLYTIYNKELRKEGITQEEVDNIIGSHKERIFYTQKN